MDNIETPRSTTRKTIGEELTKFGWSELRCGHHDKTWKAFTAAHKENIEDAEAWKGLGWVALRERQWVQAAGCFAVVIQLRPDDSEAIFCHAKSVDMAGGESLCALESYERFLMCSQANRNADIIEMRKEAQQRIMELDRGQ